MKVDKHTLYSYFVCLLFFMSLYNKALQVIPIFGFTQYIDELLLLSYIPASFLTLAKFRRKDALTIVIWFVIVTSWFFSLLKGTKHSMQDLFIASVINIKLFIFFDFLRITVRDYKPFTTLINTVIVVSAIGILLNVIFGTRFNAFFQFSDFFRFESLRVGGFEGNSNNVGLLLVFCFFYFTMVIGRISLPKTVMIVIGFLFICLVFLGSRSPLFALIIAAGTLILLAKLRSRILIVTIFPILLLAGFEMADAVGLTKTSQVQLLLTNFSSIEQGDDSKYMRAIIISNGVKLMQKNFPFGSGVGTFASAYANKFYNPIYQDIGLYKRKVAEGGGLYDSNFGSIAGELGVYGLIFISVLFYLTLQTLMPQNRHRYKLFLYCVFLYILYSFFIRATINNSYPSIIFSIFMFAFALESYKGSLKAPVTNTIDVDG